jgi:minichromosome maintenance protein 10
MERQLNELKKELNKQTTTNKQQQQTTTAQQIAMQQTATFAKKKRVAHNQVGTEPKKVKNEQRDGDMTNDTSYDTDPYSGLRIKDPLVSSVKMRERMNGRRMIKIPQIVSNVRNGDIEGDWVTIGTIVYKLPPKDTSKGSKYSVWKLSDLSSQTSVMALFLFDKVFENHWKTPIGHVIALLNPRIQTDRQKRY